MKGRVSGSLAVTRALGDLELKTQGVSNVPDTGCPSVFNNVTGIMQL